MHWFGNKKTEEPADDQSAAPYHGISFNEMRQDFTLRTSYHVDYYKQNAEPRLRRWLGSVSYRGRVREECLRYLIDHYRPGDENRILLRLEDWVDVIRDQARKWILDHFHELPFEAITENGRLILYLSRKRRLRDDPALAHINEVLQARIHELDENAFFTLDPIFRRYLFSLSLDTDQTLRPWLLHDPDPFNRGLLLSHPACAELNEQERTGLQRERAVALRRRYYQRIIAQGLQPGEAELRALALAPNRSLRLLGRHYLHEIYGVDAYELYKAQQDASFFYICDFARAEDIGHFKQGLEHPKRSVRVSCLKALAKADHKQLAELDWPALMQDGREARAVFCIFGPGLFDPEQLAAFRPFFEAASPGGLRPYLELLRRRSWLHFAEESLRCLRSDLHPRDARFIKDRLRLWTLPYNWSPDPVLLRQIREHLQALHDHQDCADLVKQLEFILREELSKLGRDGPS